MTLPKDKGLMDALFNGLATKDGTGTSGDLYSSGTNVFDSARRMADQRRIFEEISKATQQKRWLSIDEAEGLKDMGGKHIRQRTFKYKDITFIVNLEDEAMEFFEDPKNISRDELRILSVTFPEYYKKIEAAWTDAYIKAQAKKVFESN